MVNVTVLEPHKDAAKRLEKAGQKLMTCKQVAEALGCSQYIVRQYTRLGKFARSYRTGRYEHWLSFEVLDWLRDYKAQSKALASD